MILGKNCNGREFSQKWMGDHQASNEQRLRCNGSESIKSAAGSSLLWEKVDEACCGWKCFNSMVKKQGSLLWI